MKNKLFLLVILAFTLCSFGQSKDPKIFISVDMEGIGGIGSRTMVQGQKDYNIGRKLMTDEVNAVVAAIFESGPAEIVVNDSHGDMQNLIHTDLDQRVSYIQNNIKSLGMVQGLDDSFDAVIFIGYHAMAGTENGFLSHTGSGAVMGLWINGTEVGEGGLNTFFANAIGVPVILASGDKTFCDEIKQLISPITVVTKESIGNRAAKLTHPEVVKRELHAKTKEAMKNINKFNLIDVKLPVEFVIEFNTPTRADVAMGIPGFKRVNGNTISYEANNMDEAYRLIRIAYKYLSW